MEPIQATNVITPNQIVNRRIKCRPANKTLVLKPEDLRLKNMKYKKYKIYKKYFIRPANKTLVLKPGDPRLKSYYPDEPVNNTSTNTIHSNQSLSTNTIHNNQLLSNQVTMMQNGEVIPTSELQNVKCFAQKFTPRRNQQIARNSTLILNETEINTSSWRKS